MGLPLLLKGLEQGLGPPLGQRGVPQAPWATGSWGGSRRWLCYSCLWLAPSGCPEWNARGSQSCQLITNALPRAQHGLYLGATMLGERARL